MNILEKADKYADGKANEAITKAIAQAYMDGYRDGYNDREAEIPVDFRNNKTTYVDLGLPSRTLWSADYEKKDNSLLYFPYEKADYSKLPTIKQWCELRDKCKWEYLKSGNRLLWVKCIGPNGNIIKFERTGHKRADIIYDPSEVYFWLEEDGKTKAANIHLYSDSSTDSLFKVDLEMFSGYYLPIRLVR